MSEDDDQEEPGKRPTQLPRAVAGGFVALTAERLAGPGGAVIAGVSLPFLEELTIRAWDEFRSDGRRRQAEMLASAAEAMDCDPEELDDQIRSSEETRLLTATAMAGAAGTAWPPKVRALGRALAAGLIADDAEIDLAGLVLPAMTGMERPHVSLLELLVRWTPVRTRGREETKRPYEERGRGQPRSSLMPDPRRWDEDDVGQARPELQRALPSLIGTLQRNGLIVQNDDTATVLAKYSEAIQRETDRRGKGARNRQGVQMPPRMDRLAAQHLAPPPSWSPTELGERVLEYYQLAADELDSS